MLQAARPAIARRRLAALALLGLGVSAGHLWGLGQAWPARLGPGAQEAPPRIEVAFVRELAPAEPPAVAPRRAAPPPPAGPRLRQLAAPPELAASAPEPLRALADKAPLANPDQDPAAAPAVPAEPAAAPAPAEVTTAPTLALDALPELGAPPVAAPAFEWPPSTRLSYRLTGDVRGPVEGLAQVEWLRSGTRYQVHLDVGVGPSFAPFMSRRASSEGEITADGLRPARFDEETRILLRDPRRVQVRMDADSVTLAGGRVMARPEGLQDTASQFVQLTFLFTTDPSLLQPGQQLSLPLALPRRVLPWLYEVGEPEWLETPAGSVWATPVRPRPDVAGEAGRLGDLVPEAWFAPSLQYLPVRILIRLPAGGLGGGGHVDLLLERLPQQAEPGR